ncbi:MAG: TonB-dependent receptor plug domain-containing protein [Bacteroidota bacterium]
MKNIITTLFWLSISLLVPACSSVKTTATAYNGKDKNRNKMELTDAETSQEFALEIYLKKTPGVMVRGTGTNAIVQVRGSNSFSGSTEPLFVINGNAIGSNYATAADLLRGMDIKSVEVLKGADASLYGVRGAGGVILIQAR